jgi:hypothetical protein
LIMTDRALHPPFNDLLVLNFQKNILPLLLFTATIF